MGHSFTEHRGRGFWCDDGGLVLWLDALVGVVDALDDAEPWLERARTHWHEQVSGRLVGMVSAGLDEICTDDARAARVIEVAMLAIDSLSERPTLFARELNARRVGAECEWIGDIPTAGVRKVGEVFVALLEARVWTETSSRPWLRFFHDDAMTSPPESLVRARARR